MYDWGDMCAVQLFYYFYSPLLENEIEL
jgi:hypothetical protein